MSLISQNYASREELNQKFAEQILTLLSAAIEKNKKASLVVSGGSTPKPLFELLSQSDFAWDKVTITLADERWLPTDHKDSNERLVRENLLVNKAKSANFVGLTNAEKDASDAEQKIAERIDAIGEKFDVLILGMGEDAHTASLFPCSEQISKGLDLNLGQSMLATRPSTAPYQRMSMSLARLLKSDNVFLHLTGEKKKLVLNDALANYTSIEKPIKAVCDNTNVKLVWAP